MTPTPADNAQRLVMRWLAIVSIVVVVVFLAATWWRDVRACRATCEAQGKPAAGLEFKGGGRFELGTRCVCGTGRD